ncbi:transmembrane protein 181 [Camelus ferus]|nr:transmembrane protein 181 [Camelus ferus]
MGLGPSSSQEGPARPTLALLAPGSRVTLVLPQGSSMELAEEWLAPMRLYTLSKRHFVLVFVVFFVCFGLTVFVGIRETSLQTNFLMTVKVDGVAQDGTTIHNKVHNRTRTLTCAEKCAEIIVVHLGYLNYTQYTVIVGFEHLSPPIKEMNFTPRVLWTSSSWTSVYMFIFLKDSGSPSVSSVSLLLLAVSCPPPIASQVKTTFQVLQGLTRVDESGSRPKLEGLPSACGQHVGHLRSVRCVLDWKTYDPAFSKLEIWFRFVFVVLTFIVTCLFAHSLRKFSMRDWGIEQKWMSILLPLLLLYNDPFFPLSFLVNSWFPGMLDDLFQSVFLCALLLFWLCVYHGIRVQGMKVFFMVVAAVYILYLLFLIVRACSELRHMPYVESQLKDNPAFSMLNDSDDDVIYGSDYEEMPLQNGQAIRAQYKEGSESD